ncbi:hypothetical protein K466DRAFT_667856 [Polyporus arcularius HHB13444]|uniref:Uncharacterized protein n=1 Tax=Polyporus arcularius HHB13444 TaxID=1314778 RepID=A0A5C3NRU5_9APHY|nr:hypothetical protein K466DRAFT_667856 [Polyporus arcularius HHB13444]
MSRSVHSKSVRGPNQNEAAPPSQFGVESLKVHGTVTTALSLLSPDAARRQASNANASTFNGCHVHPAFAAQMTSCARVRGLAAVHAQSARHPPICPGAVRPGLCRRHPQRSFPEAPQPSTSRIGCSCIPSPEATHAFVLASRDSHTRAETVTTFAVRSTQVTVHALQLPSQMSVGAIAPTGS